jgi:hypothetical protein
VTCGKFWGQEQCECWLQQMWTEDAENSNHVFQMGTLSEEGRCPQIWLCSWRKCISWAYGLYILTLSCQRGARLSRAVMTKVWAEAPRWILGQSNGQSFWLECPLSIGNACVSRCPHHSGLADTPNQYLSFSIKIATVIIILFLKMLSFFLCCFPSLSFFFSLFLPSLPFPFLLLFLFHYWNLNSGSNTY